MKGESLIPMEGGGKDLRNRGAIFGDTMQGQKARIKLMVALSYTDEYSAIKEFMEDGLYNNEL